ncbi:hypothetical protein A3SI_19636 [Nitritalea halalkaliphila LW7]|uniref:Uncharacterized protein n=1 Tax=Nitritalea halalkaliphila LW7 TaxID=1189621 RepID=I5BSL7_9BACT|nr:CRISPR-associated endonuclease Cas6 [Nitritalea halalkaliphila]EIM72569.1 hypothetical protein A3SI_19636 [Nitritalea halalkaliphila LW7]
MKDVLSRSLASKQTVDVLALTFALALKPSLVPKFRGAMCALLEDAPILMHNHKGEGFNYTYPRIQYQSFQGQARLIAINEGTDILHTILAREENILRVGNQVHPLRIKGVEASQTYLVRYGEEKFHYQLRSWQPFNAENYRRYQGVHGLSAQVHFLEAILRGNILSMAKGLGITLTDQVEVTLTSMGDMFMRTFKEQEVCCLDISFTSSISLPEGVGLGKGVSIGFGTIIK